MFHPLEPAPCFLYAWPAVQAVEVIYAAIAKALPKAVPSSSSGDFCSMVWWGNREATGEPWAEGAPHPVGQGAWSGGDGSTLMFVALNSTRTSPHEVWESKNPWILDKMELAQDSGGSGRYRGGCGIDYHFRMLEDAYITPVVERTRFGAPGIDGGDPGRPNNARVRFADGRVVDVPKVTRFLVPKGAVLELLTGGGSGYGPAGERTAADVEKDLRDGYISPAFAARHYPQFRA
jgi:N-methylhydantoinase B